MMFLVRLAMRPGPAHADEYKTDGAGDQAVAGRVTEPDMPLAQHERDRDRRAGRNQHPVRPADIGDGAEGSLAPPVEAPAPAQP